MASLPGSAGFAVIGDKSLEFYKNPVKFVDKKIRENKSRLFVTRVLNKPAVVIASYYGVKELLDNHADKTDLGYQSFMGDVFGENILYSDGEKAAKLRQLMSHLFNDAAVKNFHVTVDRLVNKLLAAIDEAESPLPVYTYFKQLTTEICLTLFLDLDFEQSQELASQIIQLTTQHWHGIISIPMKLKLPLPGFSTYSSGYGKAIEAKEALSNIIDKKLSVSPRGLCAKFADTNFPSPEDANNNLLLFTCALVPKALAAVMTSFVLAANLYEKGDLLSKIEKDPEYHDRFLLEVLRLWPPFFGGRRLANEDIECQGYRIPKGYSVLYTTTAAHRDPEAFDNPDGFDPSRWRDKQDIDKLLCFGFGPRICIGRTFVWDILKTTTLKVLSHFSWNVPEGQSLSYKYLPVSRPKEKVLVEFILRKKHPRLDLKESVSEDSETLFERPKGEENDDVNKDKNCNTEQIHVCERTDEEVEASRINQAAVLLDENIFVP